MKRIFAWQTDTSTCHLYRTQFPFEELAKTGEWEVSWGAPPQDIKSYDVVVGQRITGYNTLWRDLAHDFKGLLVLDLDDDLVDVDPHNTVPYSIYQPQRLDTIANIQMADVVTVSTPKLAKKVKRFRGDDAAVVLPNCAHPDWIKPNPPYGLTIGYMGSPFHAQDWTPPVKEALDAFATTYPHARFHMMGGHYYSRVGVMLHGMMPMEYVLHNMEFWVGLAPLVRNEFNESKSWCKAMEYACRGIPIIASDVGQYREWIESGGGGFLVENESVDSWLDALDQMADLETRALMAQKAIWRAKDQTIDKHAHLWAKVYNGAW
jgi:glycosyltransferase involved in cell wall biosynthesis